MSQVRITRVSDSFYKFEVVATVSPFTEPIARAMRNALSSSGLGLLDFFQRLLDAMGMTTETATPFFANSGLSLESAAQAVMAGEVVPCSDVLLAAAVVAGTTVGILLDEFTLADQVRVLLERIAALERRGHQQDSLSRPSGGFGGVVPSQEIG